MGKGGKGRMCGCFDDCHEVNYYQHNRDNMGIVREVTARLGTSACVPPCDMGMCFYTADYSRIFTQPR